MNLVNLITELESQDKRIAQLKQVIRQALEIKDLWNEEGKTHSFCEEHEGELQALNKMEQEFKRALEL